LNDHQLDDFFGFKSPDEEKKRKEGIRESILKNLGQSLKLRLIPRVLSQKERRLILALLILVAGSIASLPFTFYYHFTATRPDYGGSFSEGVIGEPRHINPLLAKTDADNDLTELIFSGLMKYNDTGKLVPDLAKSYEISSDGLKYTVYIKEDAEWSDGKPVSADDIIFTIQTIQNSDYGSSLRINWQGVEVEKAGDYAVIFKLKNKYAQFLNNLTVKILPKHLWQDIKPINFALSELNIKPIASGPFKFKKLKKDKLGAIRSYELEANKNFYDGRPYIDNIEFKFYASEDAMIDAHNKGEIGAMSFVSPKNIKKIKFKQRLSIQKINMPRYFAVFFNQNQSKLLSDKNVRLALAYGTDKNDLIKQVLDDNGITVDSPLVGGALDISDSVTKYSYDPDNAKKMLSTAGWTNADEHGILSKKDGSDRLSVKITTSTWPELAEVANILKEQWSKIGVEVNTEVLPITELQQTIKDRGYQTLLFGEILNIDPDPFSLWHSSQKREPGLNLALYDNKAADTLLEDARQTLNPLERAKKYDDFQKLVAEDIPAIFLYNPQYLYAQSNKINGFDSKIIAAPSDRFANANQWYVETKRAFGEKE